MIPIVLLETTESLKNYKKIQGWEHTG